MGLNEWFEEQPEGAMTEMMRATKLSWSTICRAKRGDRVSKQSAKIISKYTKGSVSVETLRPKRPSRNHGVAA